MCGVNRHKELEVNLFCGKFVGKLSEEMLKLTACAQIRNTEGIANRLENPTALFARSVSLGSKLINSVNVLIGFIVGTGEEANSAVTASILAGYKME